MSATGQYSSFETWARVTGLHGALDCYSARTPFLKIVWLTVITFGCMLGINQSLILITDFLTSSPWLTGVSYELAKEGMQWPNMSMCVLNWMDKSKLANIRYGDISEKPWLVSYAMNYQDGINFYNSLQKNESDQINASSEEVGNFSDWFHAQLDTQNLVEVRQNLFAQNCEETIMACGKNKKFDIENDTRTCCHGSALSPDMGCFKLKLDEIFHGKKADAGFENGIYFLLNPQMDNDYSKLLMGDKTSAGFSIELYFGDNEGATDNPHLRVAPATNTIISMTAKKNMVRPRSGLQTFQSLFPYKKPCISKADYKFLAYATYTIKHCQDDCFARYYIYSEINCTDQMVTLKDNNRRCPGNTSLTFYELEKTVINALYVFEYSISALWAIVFSIYSYRSGLGNIPPTRHQVFNLTECIDQCLEPCDQKSISASVSFSDFPAPRKRQYFENYLVRSFDKSQSFKGLTLLELYYATNQYYVIMKTTRTTADELMSSIGGSLGVWTGISAVTLVQAAIYIAYGINRVFEQRRMKERRIAEQAAIDRQGMSNKITTPEGEENADGTVVTDM